MESSDGSHAAESALGSDGEEALAPAAEEQSAGEEDETAVESESESESEILIMLEGFSALFVRVFPYLTGFLCGRGNLSQIR